MLLDLKKINKTFCLVLRKETKNVKNQMFLYDTNKHTMTILFHLLQK